MGFGMDELIYLGVGRMCFNMIQGTNHLTPEKYRLAVLPRVRRFFSTGTSKLVAIKVKQLNARVLKFVDLFL